MTEDVVDAVRSLLPTVAAAAAGVDAAGAVQPDAVARLQDAGVFTLLQPREFGGRQADPDTFLTVIRNIAGACASTGWLAAMLTVNAWHFALFDDRALQDVWGAEPRALVCASYAPTGRLERAGDGFRLSGRWTRCTGVQHAAWLIVGALVVSDGGAAEDFTVALVPRSDYVVEPAWNGLGLRGIGADDVVVSGARVPGYRTFGWVDDVQRAALDPLYRLPQPALYNYAGTAPVVGAALRALAAHRPQDLAPLSRVAMAGTDLDLSVLQMRRNLADLYECARANTGPDAELMLRARRDQTLAFDRARQAVQLLVGRPDADGRLERVWRDIQTAHLHVANDVDRVLSTVGQFALGVPVDAFIV